MPRKAEDKSLKKGVVITDEEREIARKRRSGLVEPSYDEVEAALKAEKPCGFCLSGEAKKKNEAGRCIVCDGKHLVRDHEQRRWAAAFVLERADPAPKAIEAKIEDNRSTSELVKEYEGKSPEEIKEL